MKCEQKSGHHFQVEALHFQCLTLQLAPPLLLIQEAVCSRRVVTGWQRRLLPESLSHHMKDHCPGDSPGLTVNLY